MVLLAAAICTKNGKALISRQFVEMSRSRIEGLLSAFPKLMNSEQQHTFVETESVRYVYQSLDKLFMLLITTKHSNILEDLETLRLFSRVVPEYCKVLEEDDILENSFQLIFAFDEIVALGYRENVNLAQIRTFIEMDSHEERVINAVRKTQELEAKEQSKRKAKELQAARTGANKGRGFLGSLSSSATTAPTTKAEVSPIIGDTAQPVSPPASKAPKANMGKGKAMKLGGKSKDIDTFVDKLREEGTEVASVTTKSAVKAAPTPSVPTSSVHCRINEKLSLNAGRDGGLQNMEVSGIVMLRITDPAFLKILIDVENNDDKGFQMQTHPNVNKKLFCQDSIIGLKGGKGFPINNEIGVLKWRLQTKEEYMIPLTINCWPNENGDECEVTIEYELQLNDMELNDVTISIPVPAGVGAPSIGEVDGDYNYDAKKATLEWKLPVINASNPSGSMEFTMSAIADDFFPINVSFYSTKTICDIVLNGVRDSETQSPVKFSQERSLTVDKYEIGSS